VELLSLEQTREKRIGLIGLRYLVKKLFSLCAQRRNHRVERIERVYFIANNFKNNFATIQKNVVFTSEFSVRGFTPFYEMGDTG